MGRYEDIRLYGYALAAFDRLSRYRCPLCGERYMRRANRDRCAARCKRRALEFGRAIQLRHLERRWPMSDEEVVALTPGDDQSLLGLILKTTREFYGTQGEAYLRRQLAAAHAEGARQEREACAALALNSRPPLSHTAPFAIGYEAACEDIEQAIRQREARP
jgi:hypothetical protein